MSAESQISTYLFDHKLFLEGKWKNKEHKLLFDWISTPDSRKKEVSAKIIGELINSILGDDLSDKGRINTENIEDNLMHLESILNTTKGGIIRKFYRDHLNHSIRVLLLAIKLANSLSIFDLTEENLKKLKIASLFHDFSYPLSEIYEIYNAIIKAMKEIYTSVRFPDFICSDDPELICQLIDLIDNPIVETVKIGKELAKRNHSVLSSMEFLLYVKPERWSNYVESVQAILLHDPSFEIEFNYSENQIIALLILADELQDWGRISTYELDLTISEIKGFLAENSRIYGEIFWKDTSTLSPFRQIFSKQNSLKRIIFQAENKFEFEIKYYLPTYDSINYISFEKVLKKMIDLFAEKDKIYENIERIDVLEERLFGIKGEEFQKVIDYFEKYDEKKSMFKNLLFLINLNRNECLVIDSNFSDLKTLSILINNGFYLKINNGSNEKKCLLVNQYDTKIMTLYKNMSKHFSILNQLSSTRINTPPYRIPPRNFEEFKNNLKKYELNDTDIKNIEKILYVPNILKKQGLFFILNVKKN